MAKGESRGNKRKFGGRGSHYGPTPRRGPPALFVTCESGREKKCQREALELIHHYYYGSKHTTTDTESKGTSEDVTKSSPSTTTEEDDKPLSLQEELAMLRKGAVAEEVLNSNRPRHGSTNGIATSSKQVSTMKSPFSIYNSGMRGMVCILCTLPNCEMVPYDQILAELKAAKEKDNTAVTNNVNDDEKGSIKVATEASKEIKVNEVKWDPVDAVRRILQDAKIMNKKTEAKDNDSKQKDIGQAENDQKEAAALLASSPPPGSRYISRILPMQATVSECIFFKMWYILCIHRLTLLSQS